MKKIFLILPILFFSFLIGGNVFAVGVDRTTYSSLDDKINITYSTPFTWVVVDYETGAQLNQYYGADTTKEYSVSSLGITELKDFHILFFSAGNLGTAEAVCPNPLRAYDCPYLSSYYSYDYKVSYVDNTPPVITLNGSATVTVLVGGSYTDAGATALDNVDGDITADIASTTTVNTAVAGVYSVTYNVSDAAGNPAAEVTRTVRVITYERTPAGYFVPASVSFKISLHDFSDACGGSLSETSIYWGIVIENSDKEAISELIPRETLSHTFSSFRRNVDEVEIPGIEPGGYYYVKFACSNTDESIITNYWIYGNVIEEAIGNGENVPIFTVDNMSPVITLVGSPIIELYVGDSYTDAGATATDNINGDITANIASTTTVNTAVVGSYSVTYNVLDSAGNAAVEVERTVNVIPAPVTGGSVFLIPTDTYGDWLAQQQVEPEVLGVKIENPGTTGGATGSAGAESSQILIDAAEVWSKNNLPGAETNNYLSNLTDSENLSSDDVNRLNYFINDGTPTTIFLGAGERAGVLNSYQSTFGKLPETEAEWQDVIRIANGQLPSEKNQAAEAKAKEMFKKVFGREADLSKAGEELAVNMMAYGLRPAERSLDSEKAAIGIFKFYFDKNPAMAADWDIVRAIAYSGVEK